MMTIPKSEICKDVKCTYKSPAGADACMGCPLTYEVDEIAFAKPPHWRLYELQKMIANATVPKVVAMCQERWDAIMKRWPDAYPASALEYPRDEGDIRELLNDPDEGGVCWHCQNDINGTTCWAYNGVCFCSEECAEACRDND